MEPKVNAAFTISNSDTYFFHSNWLDELFTNWLLISGWQALALDGLYCQAMIIIIIIIIIIFRSARKSRKERIRNSETRETMKVDRNILKTMKERHLHGIGILFEW